jgi:hypothetical protein
LQNVPSFEELFRRTERTAVHLEMRDHYAIASEAPDVAHWKATGEANTDPDSAYWRPWVAIVQEAVGRGVVLRRARIISESPTDYIRFEHAITPLNLSIGERVRWLPRNQASDLALPGNDFWLFDGELVRFNHFTGDGDGAAVPFVDTDDPGVAKLCETAFEAVWERAVPHAQFEF